MNYAIKTLLNQGKLCADSLEQKEKYFLETDFLITSDYEFVKSDIENLKHQINELSDAIEKLSK
jgi:polyhydroxyalkanoate synthesis regulator phasin